MWMRDSTEMQYTSSAIVENGVVKVELLMSW